MYGRKYLRAGLVCDNSPPSDLGHVRGTSASPHWHRVSFTVGEHQRLD
jgi:hypothetical protein